LHCVLVRSPHAHANIRRIDSGAAVASPGVAAVLTGADMAADKVGPMAPLWAIQTSDGKPMAKPPRWALARGTVRHAGEAIAAVIAQTQAQAQDAAELLQVDYEPLPVVTGGRAAMNKDAPQLHDSAPGNVCFRFARGDEEAVRKAFDSAAHVVKLDLANNRLIGAAIEPRAVLASIIPRRRSSPGLRGVCGSR
jgi:carbon-monoxide dehydrogenase large subunit